MAAGFAVSGVGSGMAANQAVTSNLRNISAGDQVSGKREIQRVIELVIAGIY